MTAEIFQIKDVLLKCAFVAVSIRERIFKILLGGFGRGDGRPASKKTIYIRGHEKKYSWAYGSLLVELWRFRFFLNLSGNDSRWSSGAFVSGAELFLLPDDLRRSVFSIFGTLRSERMFFPLRRGCARESRQRRQYLSFGRIGFSGEMARCVGSSFDPRYWGLLPVKRLFLR